MEFSFNEKLPQISFKLFSSIDPEKNLDSLQCPICFQYYLPFSPRRPAICCKNKHIACEKCINNLIEKNKQQNQANKVPSLDRKPAICMFCRQPFQQKMMIDQGRVILSRQLQKISSKLKEVSQEVRLLMIKDCQRKAKRQYEKRMQELQQREIEYYFRQETMKATVQSCLDKQRSLQIQLTKAKTKIEELQKKNLILRGEDDVVIPPKRPDQSLASQKRSIPKHIFHHNLIYNEFIFFPFRNKDYWLNFQDKKVNAKSVFRLNRSRIPQLKHQQHKKIVIHNKFFNFSNQQDRILCFRLRNVNSKVLRYSFGLMDEHYEQIKGASASLYLDLTLGQPAYEGMQGTIMFYVDLVNRKLTIEAGRAKYRDNIHKTIKMTKFTVYIYFADNETQYELIDPQSI